MSFDCPPEPPENDPSENLIGASSQFDNLLGQMRQELRDSVQAEVREELDRLRAENETLRRRCTHLDFLEEAARSAREAYGRASRYATQQANQEARRAKARDLLKVLATPKYKVVFGRELGPKCDECNEQRNLKFVSPRGNDHFERCACADSHVVYQVEEMRVCSVDHQQSGMKIWYKPADSPSDHGLETLHVSNPVGVAMEDLMEGYRDYGFDDRESAQALADAMNKKVGETPRAV